MSRVFGYPTIGGSSASLTADFKRGTAYNLPERGLVSKVTAYLAGSAQAQVVRAGIYSDNNVNPESRRAMSPAVTIAAVMAPQWVDFVFTPAMDLEAGDYWLTLLAGAVNGQAFYYYDARPDGMRVNPDTYSDGASDPWGPNTTFADRKISISATYTPVDTRAPSIAVTSPLAGTIVSGAAVALAADASDNIGIVGVQFQVDGLNVGAEDTVAPYTATWNTTGIEDGSHTVTAVARDASGNVTTSAPSVVTVANQPDFGAPVAVVVGWVEI